MRLLRRLDQLKVRNASQKGIPSPRSPKDVRHAKLLLSRVLEERDPTREDFICKQIPRGRLEKPIGGGKKKAPALGRHGGRNKSLRRGEGTTSRKI